jgi:hypothetical protein
MSHAVLIRQDGGSEENTITTMMKSKIAGIETDTNHITIVPEFQFTITIAMMLTAEMSFLDQPYTVTGKCFFSFHHQQ